MHMQPRIVPFVVSKLAGMIIVLPIHFNGQFGLGAGEIQDIEAERCCL